MNDENIKKITDKLFMNSRMELEFFMYLPSGSYTTKDKSTITINSNPVLYLRYKPGKYNKTGYEYSKAVYKITPKNIYHTIKFFNTLMKWLYDESFNDLFLINEGNLIFNADYKSLNVSTHLKDYDNQIMQAIPSVVEIGDKKYEGVHLYVNNTDYCIPLTFEEVSILFSLLKDFRFSEEVIKVLTVYNYIVSHNAIVSNDMIMGNKKTPFD